MSDVCLCVFCVTGDAVSRKQQAPCRSQQVKAAATILTAADFLATVL